MKKSYSITVDKGSLSSLATCLQELYEGMSDYEYEWTVRINAGGIDYGIFINIDTERNEIEICNQPVYGRDGEDYLSDFLEDFEEEYYGEENEI